MIARNILWSLAGSAAVCSINMAVLKGSRKLRKEGPRKQSHQRSRYWLAVVKTPDDLHDFMRQPWWCLPSGVALGDRVLLYRPKSARRAADDQLLGIFAACRVTHVGARSDDERMRCAFGSISQTSEVSLNYCALANTKILKRPLTPLAIRRDTILGRQSFVRRNFQGTAFQISRLVFEHSVQLGAASSKNQSTGGKN